MISRDLHSNGNHLGKRLKKDVFNRSGILVAPARTVLNREQLRILGHRQGKNSFGNPE